MKPISLQSVSNVRWLRILAFILGVALIGILPWVINSYYTSLIIFIGIYTIIVVGLCLLMGYAGQISLGQAAFYGMGAYISGILSHNYGVNPWIAMIIAAAFSGVFAYLIGIPVLRLKGNYLAMATLGLGIIMYLVFREADFITGGPTGIPAIPYLSIGDFKFDTNSKYYYLVWVFALAVLFFSQNIVNSRVGRALRAIRNNEKASESLGVNVPELKIKVFALSAVFASIAGSLYVHYLTYVNPQPFDYLFSIRLLLMAVVGGLASIWGAIFGVASVTILGDILHQFGDWETIVFGLVLMAVVIFMPKGIWFYIFGWFESLRQKFGKVRS